MRSRWCRSEMLQHLRWAAPHDMSHWERAEQATRGLVPSNENGGRLGQYSTLAVHLHSCRYSEQPFEVYERRSLGNATRRRRTGRPPGCWEDALVAARGTDAADKCRNLGALLHVVASGVVTSTCWPGCHPRSGWPGQPHPVLRLDPGQCGPSTRRFARGLAFGESAKMTLGRSRSGCQHPSRQCRMAALAGADASSQMVWDAPHGYAAHARDAPVSSHPLGTSCLRCDQLQG